MASPQSRPVAKSDEAFLYELFCSVRTPALGPANLPAAALEPLLRMQYAGQRTTYASHFPRAEHSIVLQDGQPVGACYVSRSEEEIRLVNVALLPAQRGAGLGTALVHGLQDEARASGRPLHLSVDVSNVGARRFYERLGFEDLDRSPTHIEMAWRADR
jgi:ribosomal protein S18 acetylase RimI-like enzyme